jgi:hypothetical protein
MPVQYHPKSAQHNSLIAKIAELTKRNSMLTESNEALTKRNVRLTDRNARLTKINDHLTKSNEAFAMSEHHREALGFPPESMLAEHVATLAVMNITF